MLNFFIGFITAFVVDCVLSMVLENRQGRPRRKRSRR
jgi:hypothetical protein